MSYLNITKERAKEILKQYEEDKAIFNWCKEYNDFVNSNVLVCVSVEWDYMLKKSYEDSESPVSYEDLETPYIDFEQLRDDFKENKEKLKDYKKWLKRKGIEDTETDFESEDEDNLKEYLEDTNQIEEYERNIEIYEWWIIEDPLKYRLEEEREIFLNGAWGRQTTGQRIILDNVVIHAFISWLEDRI